MHNTISQPMFLDEIGKPVGIVPGENSVVAVIGYRLISFWLTAFTGFMLSPILNRKKADSPEKVQISV